MIEGDLVDVRVAAIEARTAQRKPVALALGEVRRILGTTVDAEGITAATVERCLRRWDAACNYPSGGFLAGRLCPVGVSISSARSISSKKSRASTATTASPIRCRLLARACGRCPGLRRNPRCGARCWPPVSMRQLRSTFCSAAEAALTAPQPGLVVPLGNPLSEEAGVLRPSLVPGMLAMIAGNLHRDVSDVRLFELGTVFSGTTEKVEERPAVAFGAAGSLPEQARCIPRARSRFLRCERRGRAGAGALSDAGGLLRSLSRRGRTHACVAPSLPGGAHRRGRHNRGLVRPAASARGRGAQIQRSRCWWASSISTASTSFRCASRWRGRSRASSRCGAIFRSFWTTASRGRPSTARSPALQIPELVDWRVREVFRDARLGAGDYSLLLGVTFQAADRTLREEELKSFQAQVVEAVGKSGARLRT